MGNISKKTRKKINKILLSNHFKKKSGVTQDTLVYTPNPESPYKKNYIYLNSYTMYVVEDITGTMTDPYHYKLYFHTDILPDVEVKP